MDENVLRRHLVSLLTSKNAHASFEAVVRDFPEELRGVRPEGQAHTAWRLLEHLRIAQWDILEFCRDAEHVSPDWPEGYWPAEDAPPDRDAWDRSLTAFRRDLEAMCELVNEEERDLAVPVPWGDGPSILHETLLVADHNAYHLGQLVTLRQLLGAWPPGT